MAQMTPLRRRLLDDMTVRNLSPATQQSYVYAVAKFSRFFGVAPDQLGNEGDCQEFRVGRVRWRQRRPPDAPTQSPAYS
jgi:integrase/recombinase XerD